MKGLRKKREKVHAKDRRNDYEEWRGEIEHMNEDWRERKSMDKIWKERGRWVRSQRRKVPACVRDSKGDLVWEQRKYEKALHKGAEKLVTPEGGRRTRKEKEGKKLKLTT